VPLRTTQLLARPPHAAISQGYVSSGLIRNRRQDTNSAVFTFGTWKHSFFLRLKQFTVLIPPNTTYCLLYSLYTLIKMSYFLERYAAGKIFRCFSYDFSFYMKSLSTTLSVIFSKQQVIIVTHLYLLSLSVSMKRKHTPYPLFSAKL